MSILYIEKDDLEVTIGVEKVTMSAEKGDHECR